MTRQLARPDLPAAHYRANLEAEKNRLLAMLESPHIGRSERVRGTNRVREILNQLDAMDAGNNWTQAQGDTAANIVMNNLSLGKKVMR